MIVPMTKQDAHQTDEKNLTRMAYDQIKKSLIDGSYQQGSLISISALAGQLNISRTPITNACLLLEHEGYLTIVPKQGVLVKYQTINDIWEVHELRAAIETYAAKCAFPHFTEEDIAFLESSYQRQVETVSMGDPQAFMREDIIFHKYLIGKYENSKSLSIINDLYEHAYQMGLQNVKRKERLIESLQEHRGIIDSLVDKDCAAYVSRTEEHIFNGFHSLTWDMTHRREAAR